MVIKFKHALIFCFILLFSQCSSYAGVEHGKWDNAKCLYKNEKYNLQWDLSGAEWRIAEDYRLPENMIFCAAMQDDFLSLSLCAFQTKEKLNGDLWEHSDKFINGYIKSLTKDYQLLPGIENNTIDYEKCYFLFKKALRFGCLHQVSDTRIGNDPIEMLSGGYAFEKGNILFVAMIMLPYEYIETYGDDAVDMFFRKLSYIDATKEAKK